MELQGRDLKVNMQGDDVALLHKELALLGYEIPSQETGSKRFGARTGQAVRQFQGQHGLEQTGVVDTETARAINAAVDAATFTVEGKVVSRDRAGVDRLRVKIVDKNVGGDVRLAEAVTDDGGGYRVRFTIADLQERGKQRPDLQARVFVGETFLGASEVRYNASNQQTLNVPLTEKASAALASEHETLVRALSAHFQGNLRDVKETDDRQDITYLANKTGWDARAVALASLADQFSARTTVAGGAGIEPAFFYALFRTGLPANENAVYQTDAKTAEAIWKRAIAEGVIPTALENRIPQAMAHFHRLAAQHALEGPAFVGVSPLKEMLSVSVGNDPGRQRRFADLYTRHRGDLPKFWEAVRSEFGEAVEKRLRLDGQLAYLTLNNASLIRRLHAASGQDGLSDTVSLAASGYYRAEKWQQLIGDGAIPPEIPGENHKEKRSRYAELLAAQVRLSFPTAVVAAMVKSRETPIADGLRDQVHGFLTEHQGKFEIGMQPVKQYVARNNLQIAPEVTKEVTRIQRVYQITPSDGAMNALLKRGVDSAYAVVRYSRNEFVRAFKEEVGGETNARLVHAKAQEVHNAVLNIITSYLIARTAPAIGVHSPAEYVDPAPKAAHASDVIAYSTLEDLFGEMDYCACEHCRSILSPAAYLVNLLQFLDPYPDAWKEDLDDWKNEHGAPYPFANNDAWVAAGKPPAADTDLTPLEVLLSRRPDIQHLPLTCENTNTPLPYIDLVNETLEHFVTNNLSLDNYTGHTIESSVTVEELLASPQFVSDTAYATLATAHFPPPLPFHQPLENLRRYFDRFEAPLPKVMEALRKDDSLERANPSEYGWRDILMEELKLSRAEYALLTARALTNGATDIGLTVKQLYGFAPSTLDAEVLARLANVKAFSRRVGISYEDIIEILKTRFVNPNSMLIPKLERLGVPFTTLKALKDGTITDTQFDALLPPALDASQYGGDIKAWVKNNANYANIMGLITATNPEDEEDLCSFDTLEFRYANPDNSTNQLRAFEFVRLIRFIRLWKKLGWSIDQTDKAITALYPADQTPNHPNDAVNLERLDAGFLTLLPRLGVLNRLVETLKLKLKKDLPPLLACFAPIDTHGVGSLYRQMFLTPKILEKDNAFADDGYGNFLTDPAQKLLKHREALRAAFQITDDELSQITAALGFDANTPLNLENISAVHRPGWLARKLKVSIREFLLLTRFTGFDPFAAPDPPYPPMLRLIELVNRIRGASLKLTEALYLIWNQDISGKSAPDETEILGFARTLRSDLAAIESAFALTDDPDGSIVRARMALVYGNDATDLFFGLLGQKVVTDVPYSHGQATLEQPILDAAEGRIAYDNLRKRLSYTAGVMPDATRDALKAVAGVTQPFKDAIDELHKGSRAFFDRYPELLLLHDAYVASNESPEKKGAELLAELLKELKPRRKRQQALQAISAATKADVGFANALLDYQFDNKYVLHAVADSTRPALDDLTALERPGLSAQFFFQDTATGPVGGASDAEANLAYSAAGTNKLPVNGNNPASAISGIWSGYLEAPENGFYNLHIDADAGATVTLTLDGETVALAQNGNLWSNNAPIEVRAGTLYAITLKVEKVKETLIVRWETMGRGREIIPPRYLYSATLTEHLQAAYVRFLKTASLATGLKLTATEIVHFAAHADYQIGSQGWLNSLPLTGSPDNPTSTALLKAFTALLDFARIKADLAPNDERLLTILKAPATAAQKPDSLLFTLTRWESASLNALLARFGKAVADLAHLDTFRRVYDAYALVKKFGVPASALTKTATNEPNATTVRDFKSALRARYDESDWLNVLRPINDDMRGLQRDALVAYILHQMGLNDETKHIDTPDKLFEYFLMDVQMDPCMQTSRIRHALSSVQLFIERCLMNLEPRVAPSSIKAKQWEWMKRYRVWEANRKVFLWPENWLEPELRDDQSPFFKETMSELLQSDITDDRAAVALLNYLSKLEEVAKLEPCGIHYVENDPGTADDIAHVVARTAGANRKYFYRRREYGYWTPWEQIKLDIEDNPVIPVVWKGRLFLFWLRILQAPIDPTAQTVNAGPIDEDTGNEKGLAQLSLSELKNNAKQDAMTNVKFTVQAVLCWSEYYNGKWQPTKTSDVDDPAFLHRLAPGGFRRSTLCLSAVQNDAFLRVNILRADGGGASFVLYNTHSLPQWGLPKPGERPRLLHTSGSTLTIRYKQGNEPTLTRPVLETAISDSTVQPLHDLHNPWVAPFFYEDSHHVFYVTTEDELVNIPDWHDYIVPAYALKPKFEIPPLVFEEVEIMPDSSGPVISRPGFGVVDRSPIERFVSEDAYISRGIATAGTVRFGDKQIGLAGSLMNGMRGQ